jgi:twitching motility protein PilT
MQIDVNLVLCHVFGCQFLVQSAITGRKRHATKGYRMHSVHELLAIAIQSGASDLLLKAGSSPFIRVDGAMRKLELPILTAESLHEFALEVLFSVGRDWMLRRAAIHDSSEPDITDTSMRELRAGHEIDVAFSIQNAARVRAHLFLERCSIGIAMRLLPCAPPTLEQLGAPQVFEKIIDQREGLVIISGPAGAGKTTTLAALVDEINRRRQANIVTIENPIEYVFPDRQSMIHQREPGADTKSIASALAVVGRISPDVVMIDALRDTETIEAAVNLAIKGCLVLTTLHAGSISDAVNYIISSFPPNKKVVNRHLFSDALLCLSAQRLLPRDCGPGRVPAMEVLMGAPSARDGIRNGEWCDIYPCIREGSHLGMNTMNQALEHLCRSKAISRETAIQYTNDPTELANLLYSR